MTKKEIDYWEMDYEGNILKWYWMEYWMSIYCYIDLEACKYHINVDLEGKRIPRYTIYKGTFDKRFLDIKKLKKHLEEKAKKIDELIYSIQKD